MHLLDLESKLTKLFVTFHAHFMNAKDSQARQAVMCEALETLEAAFNTHEISPRFFFGRLAELEQWDWDFQLREIRSLPEKH